MSSPSGSESFVSSDGVMEDESLVFINDSTFLPEDMTILVGEEISIQNEDRISHTIHCSLNNKIPAISLAPGKLCSLAFPVAGKFLLSSTTIGSMKVLISL
jgi:plastocyanin